jgi:hypothetical protein
MNDPDVTARKIALFDTAVFDQYRQWESAHDWDPVSDPVRYLRGDGTHLIYLPVNNQRSNTAAGESFRHLTKNYPPSIQTMWDNILKPCCEYLAGLTGIDDPVIVQADIARMKPVTGDTVMHTDTRYHQRYSRRYNIAISTNTDCWLYHRSYDLNNKGQRDHINEGEMWELNNKIVHTAVNRGDTWRTHLIIDVMPRNYYDRMLELYNPYARVPNPIGKNTTWDYDILGNLIHEPLFEDLPHCFPARTQIQ